MADNQEETDVVGDKDARRCNRLTWKEISEDMAENRQEMKKVRSSKFANMLRRYENTARSLVDPNTRELIAGATCLRQLTVAVKDQAQTLADVSARFSWQDLSTSTSNRFSNRGARGGLDWGKLGNEARQLFNTTPSFTTMVGPIHKEERVRKIAVRRQRENLTGVVNATSEKVENNEDDGNDEATNARVATLLKHLEAYEGQEFDLLKTLVDPINPVQSVENFFDYSYLHKEKKVKHVFNEETGTLTGCIADPGELDKAPKTQMVLSFSIGDLKRMAELLYPEVHGSTSNSNNGRSNSSRLSHPLHREDPLYEAQDAQEQVRLLAKRTTPQKTQQAQKAQTQNAQTQKAQTQTAPKDVGKATFSSTNNEAGGLSRSQVQLSHQPTRTDSSTAQNCVNNNNSKKGSSVLATQQAQSSSSRRASVEPSVASSVRSAAFAHMNARHVRNARETNDLDRMLPNGSCSSRYASTLLPGASSAVVKGTSPATPARSSVSTPGTSGTPGTACSTGTAASFSPVDGPSYTPPLSPVSSPRCIATPGTASSTVTAASVSPLVPTSLTPASTTRVRSSPATGLTIPGTGGSDARGTGRRIPPSPSISPAPPRVRSAQLGTHISTTTSAQAKFVPINPASTTDSVSLDSTESSRNSTPRSLLNLTTSNSAVKSRPFSVMSGKRALDLEELGKTEPLSQGSAKRRLAEVTPVLPCTPTHSTVSSKPHGAEDWQGGRIGQNEQIEGKKTVGQSSQSWRDSERTRPGGTFQTSKQSYRFSPESVYSERTENMFVSASDRDSDSSSA